MKSILCYKNNLFFISYSVKQYVNRGKLHQQQKLQKHLKYHTQHTCLILVHRLLQLCWRSICHACNQRLMSPQLSHTQDLGVTSISLHGHGLQSESSLGCGPPSVLSVSRPGSVCHSNKPNYECFTHPHKKTGEWIWLQCEAGHVTGML